MHPTIQTRVLCLVVGLHLRFFCDPSLIIDGFIDTKIWPENLGSQLVGSGWTSSHPEKICAVVKLNMWNHLLVICFMNVAFEAVNSGRVRLRTDKSHRWIWMRCLISANSNRAMWHLSSTKYRGVMKSKNKTPATTHLNSTIPAHFLHIKSSTQPAASPQKPEAPIPQSHQSISCCYDVTRLLSVAQPWQSELQGKPARQLFGQLLVWLLNRLLKTHWGWNEILRNYCSSWFFSGCFLRDVFFWKNTVWDIQKKTSTHQPIQRSEWKKRTVEIAVLKVELKNLHPPNSLRSSHPKPLHRWWHWPGRFQMFWPTDFWMRQEIWQKTWTIRRKIFQNLWDKNIKWRWRFWKVSLKPPPGYIAENYQFENQKRMFSREDFSASSRGFNSKNYLMGFLKGVEGGIPNLPYCFLWCT